LRHVFRIRYLINTLPQRGQSGPEYSPNPRPGDRPGLSAIVFFATMAHGRAPE